MTTPRYTLIKDAKYIYKTPVSKRDDKDTIRLGVNQGEELVFMDLLENDNDNSAIQKIRAYFKSGNIVEGYVLRDNITIQGYEPLFDGRFNVQKIALLESESKPVEALEQIRTWIDDLNSGFDANLTEKEVLRLIQNEINKVLDTSQKKKIIGLTKMNQSLTPTEILSQTRQLIEKGWTQKVYARDSKGFLETYQSENAESFCLRGAFLRTTLDNQSTSSAYKAARALEEATSKITGGNASYLDYNDQPNRRKEEILALIDLAITLVPKH